MTITSLRRSIDAIADVQLLVTDAQRAAVDESVAYLASDDAAASLAEDPYWPKWASPWWQMLLLFELGEASRIPPRAVRAMVASLDAMPLHTFPLRPSDWPAGLGLHPARHASCHCALGNIDQVLHACGVDVDTALPWIRPWFARYQMRDGGMTCDETAYLVEDECPSSMVGTIAGFEAMLRRGPSEFLDRAAAFLIERALVHGSPTRHNAAERESARSWSQPTFPRFYFYDVLRGLGALVRWGLEQRQPVPLRALAPAVEHLTTLAGDGIVRIGRRAFAGKPTWARGDDGVWARRPGADSFPLLEAVSQLGAPSPRLTAEWRTTRQRLGALIDAGLVVE